MKLLVGEGGGGEVKPDICRWERVFTNVSLTLPHASSLKKIDLSCLQAYA